MKYAVRTTTRFKKSLARMLRRGKDPAKLEAVVRALAEGHPLPPRCHDHALSGDLAGLRDCHIEPDWVLLYYIQNDLLVLVLADTGSHSDLSL